MWFRMGFFSGVGLFSVLTSPALASCPVKSTGVTVCSPAPGAATSCPGTLHCVGLYHLREGH